MKFKYQVISMPVILRDYIEPTYINDEHKLLVDIADCLYNADIEPEKLKPEAYKKYKEYGKDFWNLVIGDISAIDSQIEGHEQELVLDYSDYVAMAINPYEEK